MDKNKERKNQKTKLKKERERKILKGLEITNNRKRIQSSKQKF